jgi:hypothetical protein
MKKILFFMILTLLGLNLQAQYKDSPLQISIMGSANISWLYTDAASIKSDGVRLGYDTELHFDWFFSPRFAFSTGILWSATGGSEVFSDSLQYSFRSGVDRLAVGTKLTYHLQYVEIPLGLKLVSREIGYTTMFADFGIHPMWRLEATADTSDGRYNKEPVFTEVTRINIAHQSELGFKYSFGNKTCLLISLYYKNTFLDFTTDYLDKPADNSRINQVGLKVGFGF